MNKLLTIASALVTALPSAASAQSIWMHNNSEMLVKEEKGFLEISYVVPRKGLAAFPGSVVFKGILLGEKVIGQATLFSAKCGEINYDVRGELSPDKRTMRMTGTAPIRNDQCKPVRTREDRLEFTYLRPAPKIAAAFVGEWSSYSESCDEENAQQGPILHEITQNTYSAYETYCAFTQASGSSSSSNVEVNCRFMDTSQRMKLSFKRIENRILDMRMTGADGEETPTIRLHKCPISAADIDRAKREQASKAEQDSIAQARERAHEERAFEEEAHAKSEKRNSPSR